MPQNLIPFNVSRWVNTKASLAMFASKTWDGIFRLPGRSRANLGSTFRILVARRSSKAPNYPVISWKLPLFVVLALTVTAAVILDEMAAQMGPRWPGWLSRAARLATDIGLGGWYIVPAVLVLLFVNLTDWRCFAGKRLLLIYNWTMLGLFVLISAGLSGLIATIIKRVIGRARPSHFAEEGIFGFNPFARDASFASFPSGHATTIGAVAAILVLFFPRARYIIMPVAVFIALTRVVVGAHYPSDIIAGFAFGFAFSLATAAVFTRFGYLFRESRTESVVRKNTFFVYRANLPRQRSLGSTPYVFSAPQPTRIDDAEIPARQGYNESGACSMLAPQSSCFNHQ